MKILFKRKKNLGESTLTMRQWEFAGSAILNLVLFILMAAYLLPLSYMFVTSVKTEKQIEEGSKAPLYPATDLLYNYQGTNYSIMEVPTVNGTQEWAIVNRRRTYAEFIDPQNPDAGLIHWDGDPSELKKVYRFSVTFEAFPSLWKSANIPRAMINTLIIAAVSEIGVLLSSIAVAYGFSRFRIPGGKWLFFMLIATILIPEGITLIPTYMAVSKLIIWLQRAPFLQFPFAVPWLWLPLIAPHFFSSAIFIFLLRQNFKSIPRDLDEAAMLDGASPLQILIWIIIPQNIPAIATVAMLHFFYIWNELRNASLYVAPRQDLWPISFTIQNSPPPPGVSIEALFQVSALLLLVVPVVILFVFQRFFMQDMVITSLEK